MAQSSNAAPGARVAHSSDRRHQPSQMVTDQMDSGRMTIDPTRDGQMAAAETAASRPVMRVSAAFGTGTGSAIVFHDLASI